jgi:hypothetical protein
LCRTKFHPTESGVHLTGLWLPTVCQLSMLTADIYLPRTIAQLEDEHNLFRAQHRSLEASTARFRGMRTTRQTICTTATIYLPEAAPVASTFRFTLTPRITAHLLSPGLYMERTDLVCCRADPQEASSNAPAETRPAARYIAGHQVPFNAVMMGRDMPTLSFQGSGAGLTQGQGQQHGEHQGKEEQEGKDQISYSNPLASLCLFLCPCSSWKGWWPVRPIALVLHLSVTIPCYFLLLIPCIIAGIARAVLQCEAAHLNPPSAPPPTAFSCKMQHVSNLCPSFLQRGYIWVRVVCKQTLAATRRPYSTYRTDDRRADGSLRCRYSRHPIATNAPLRSYSTRPQGAHNLYRWLWLGFPLFSRRVQAPPGRVRKYTRLGNFRPVGRQYRRAAARARDGH